MHKAHPLEALSSTSKANVDAIRTLASSSIKATERLMALNMDFARNALHIGGDYTRQVSHAGWQKTMSHQDEIFQKGAEQTTAYLRNVQDILGDAQADFTTVVSSRIEEMRDVLTSMLDSMARSTPAGSENAIAAVRTAILNTSSAYNQVLKNAQLMAEGKPQETTSVKKAA
jgi:phasin family protein